MQTTHSGNSPNARGKNRAIRLCKTQVSEMLRQRQNEWDKVGYRLQSPPSPPRGMVREHIYTIFCLQFHRVKVVT